MLYHPWLTPVSNKSSNPGAKLRWKTDQLASDLTLFSSASSDAAKFQQVLDQGNDVQAYVYL